MGAYLAGAVLLTIPLWRILKRAGHPPALSLIALAPGGFIICLGILAFSKWKTVEA